MLIRAGRYLINPEYVRDAEVDQVPMGLDKLTRVVLTVGDGASARQITITGAEADELLRLLRPEILNPAP